MRQASQGPLGVSGVTLPSRFTSQCLHWLPLGTLGYRLLEDGFAGFRSVLVQNCAIAFTFGIAGLRVLVPALIPALRGRAAVCVLLLFLPAPPLPLVECAFPRAPEITDVQWYRFDGGSDFHDTGAMRSPSHIVVLETSDSYIPECAVCHLRLPAAGYLGVSEVLIWQTQAWYTVGVIVIILRVITRIRTVGIARFRGDDYLAFLVCCRGGHPTFRGGECLPA